VTTEWSSDQPKCVAYIGKDLLQRIDKKAVCLQVDRVLAKL
jgi:hypothetical protein